MKNLSSNIPNLEPRFLQPPGWRWHFFTRNGRTIRFGSVMPASGAPDAVVVCLPGLSEFAEKYFETARDMLAHNYAFWIIDWMGQGKSGRPLPNPHKRHSTGFQQDVDDLHKLLTKYVDRSAPLVMLAHSMGGNIGAHYLSQHPDVFACAGFSAPMFGIKAFRRAPRVLHLLPASMLNFFVSTSYVAGGGGWSEKQRNAPGSDLFSSDPVRGAVHNAWCMADPSLQVGNITYGWLYQAVKSCASLNFSATQTHCLIACAGQEAFVDNNAVAQAAAQIQHSEFINLPASKHEILMETAAIRNEFLAKFYKIVQETLVNHQEILKPA